MLPEINNLMGRNQKDDIKNQATFTVHASSDSAEEIAYDMLTTDVPFAIGAKKMLAEYL